MSIIVLLIMSRSVSGTVSLIVLGNLSMIDI
jgi:hypothetical protein